MDKEKKTKEQQEIKRTGSQRNRGTAIRRKIKNVRTFWHLREHGACKELTLAVKMYSFNTILGNLNR
jgi:hypothetical protein